MVVIDHLKSDTGPVRTPPPALLPVFRSRLVGDLLALILLNPDRTWTAEELAARTGAAYPTVTRELRRLHEAQLIVPEVVGRSKLWRANDRNAHLPAGEARRRQLRPSAGACRGAGRRPRHRGGSPVRAAGEPGPTPRDIDVLVLGRASRRDVYRAVRRTEERLGREVNAVVRPREEWESAENGFAQQVKSSPMFTVDGPSHSYDADDSPVKERRSRDRATTRSTTP
jgi:DNA-binding transcriptional ArsR family regulator